MPFSGSCAVSGNIGLVSGGESCLLGLACEEAADGCLSLHSCIQFSKSDETIQQMMDNNDSQLFVRRKKKKSTVYNTADFNIFAIKSY